MVEAGDVLSEKGMSGPEIWETDPAAKTDTVTK